MYEEEEKDPNIFVDPTLLLLIKLSDLCKDPEFKELRVLLNLLFLSLLTDERGEDTV